MTKSKILHVIDSLGQGGTEHQLLLNLSAMDRDRFENFVCHLRQVSDVSDSLSQLGIQTFCLGVTGRAQWPRSVYQLFKFIRMHRIDLVHTSLLEADLLGGIAARLAGVPVVTTLANTPYSSVWLIDNPNLNRIKLAQMKWMRRLVLHTLHAHCIAVSDFVKHASMEAFGIPENKVTVIRRAVPKEWIEQEPTDAADRLRDELGLDGAYPVLLNVGRLRPQKGQRYLIQALPQVLLSFPKAKLLVAGEGPLKTELVGLTDISGLRGHVLFLGKRSDVKTLLQVSDLFVFPSLFEGSGGNALLEAAAFGRACIASDIGPIREMIGNDHSGLLVKPRSVEALAHAITHLSHNPDIARAMGQRAREAVVHKFCIDHTIPQLETLYEMCLNGHGAAQ